MNLSKRFLVLKRVWQIYKIKSPKWLFYKYNNTLKEYFQPKNNTWKNAQNITYA